LHSAARSWRWQRWRCARLAPMKRASLVCAQPLDEALLQDLLMLFI
jgi:hypothetical protein